MNGNLVLRCVAMFVAAGLLLVGSASAQTSGIRTVSGAIEGGTGGVSAARCGTNIVVGFGDVESGNPNSFDGFAVSKDGGKTFTDGGTLPVASPTDFLGPFPQLVGATSNPAVACSSATTFYYASAASENMPGFILPNTGITVSRSTDGGAHWELPVDAVIDSADIYGFNTPTIAVDPTNPSRLYVAYIKNNVFAPLDFPDCPNFSGAAILEFIRSSDGGKTWSRRAQLDHSCIDVPGFLITPNMVVSAGGEIYLTYEFAGRTIQGQPTLNEIRFVRSIDTGLTFSAPLKVSSVADQKALPQLAVDRTHSPRRGEIYLTWSGKPVGTTHTEALVSESLDAGLSFSFPRAITPGSFSNTGQFQANPVIAVDNDGQVAACFYDTPNDTPTRSSTYMYRCASSSTHAATWQLQPVASGVPVGYDALTTDFLTHHDGFFTAFEFQNNGTRRVVGQFSDIN